MRIFGGSALVTAFMRCLILGLLACAWAAKPRISFEYKGEKLDGAFEITSDDRLLVSSIGDGGPGPYADGLEFSLNNARFTSDLNSSAIVDRSKREVITLNVNGNSEIGREISNIINKYNSSRPRGFVAVPSRENGSESTAFESCEDENSLDESTSLPPLVISTVSRPNQKDDDIEREDSLTGGFVYRDDGRSGYTVDLAEASDANKKVTPQEQSVSRTTIPNESIHSQLERGDYRPLVGDILKFGLSHNKGEFSSHSQPAKPSELRAPSGIEEIYSHLRVGLLHNKDGSILWTPSASDSFYVSSADDRAEVLRLKAYLEDELRSCTNLPGPRVNYPSISYRLNVVNELLEGNVFMDRCFTGGMKPFNVSGFYDDIPKEAHVIRRMQSAAQADYTRLAFQIENSESVQDIYVRKCLRGVSDFMVELSIALNDVEPVMLTSDNIEELSDCFSHSLDCEEQKRSIIRHKIALECLYPLVEQARNRPALNDHLRYTESKLQWHRDAITTIVTEVNIMVEEHKLKCLLENPRHSDKKALTMVRSILQSRILSAHILKFQTHVKVFDKLRFEKVSDLLTGDFDDCDMFIGHEEAAIAPIDLQYEVPLCPQLRAEYRDLLEQEIAKDSEDQDLRAALVHLDQGQKWINQFYERVEVNPKLVCTSDLTTATPLHRTFCNLQSRKNAIGQFFEDLSGPQQSRAITLKRRLSVAESLSFAFANGYPKVSPVKTVHVYQIHEEKIAAPPRKSLFQRASELLGGFRRVSPPALENAPEREGYGYIPRSWPFRSLKRFTQAQKTKSDAAITEETPTAPDLPSAEIKCAETKVSPLEHRYYSREECLSWILPKEDYESSFKIGTNIDLSKSYADASFHFVSISQMDAIFTSQYEIPESAKLFIEGIVHSPVNNYLNEENSLRPYVEQEQHPDEATLALSFGDKRTAVLTKCIDLSSLSDATFEKEKEFISQWFALQYEKVILIGSKLGSKTIILQSPILNAKKEHLVLLSEVAAKVTNHLGHLLNGGEVILSFDGSIDQGVLSQIADSVTFAPLKSLPEYNDEKGAGYYFPASDYLTPEEDPLAAPPIPEKLILNTGDLPRPSREFQVTNPVSQDNYEEDIDPERMNLPDLISTRRELISHLPLHRPAQSICNFQLMEEFDVDDVVSNFNGSSVILSFDHYNKDATMWKNAGESLSIITAYELEEFLAEADNHEVFGDAGRHPTHIAYGTQLTLLGIAEKELQTLRPQIRRFIALQFERAYLVAIERGIRNVILGPVLKDPSTEERLFMIDIARDVHDGLGQLVDNVALVMDTDDVETKNILSELGFVDTDEMPPKRKKSQLPESVVPAFGHSNQCYYFSVDRYFTDIPKDEPVVEEPVQTEFPTLDEESEPPQLNKVADQNPVITSYTGIVSKGLQYIRGLMPFKSRNPSEVDTRPQVAFKVMERSEMLGKYVLPIKDKPSTIRIISKGSEVEHAGAVVQSLSNQDSISIGNGKCQSRTFTSVADAEATYTLEDKVLHVVPICFVTVKTGAGTQHLAIGDRLDLSSVTAEQWKQNHYFIMNFIMLQYEKVFLAAASLKLKKVVLSPILVNASIEQQRDMVQALLNVSSGLAHLVDEAILLSDMHKDQLILFKEYYQPHLHLRTGSQLPRENYLYTCRMASELPGGLTRLVILGGKRRYFYPISAYNAPDSTFWDDCPQLDAKWGMFTGASIPVDRLRFETC